MAGVGFGAAAGLATGFTGGSSSSSFSMTGSANCTLFCRPLLPSEAILLALLEEPSLGILLLAPLLLTLVRPLGT